MEEDKYRTVNAIAEGLYQGKRQSLYFFYLSREIRRRD